MTAAFVYLIVTSARNRLRARLARLRNPRYALAMVLGLAYVWVTYLRPSARPAGGAHLTGIAWESLAPLFILVVVAWTWIAGTDRSALAFTEAEVTMLFSAPVPRRGLVLYRIARSQLVILLTSVVWTVLFRQGSTPASMATHIASYWVLLSALHLNRLGVALVHADAASHGARGARRNWTAIALCAVIVGVVGTSLVRAWPAIRAAGGATAGGRLAADVLSAPPAVWALLPFRVLAAPLGAAPGRAWLAAMGPALLLLVALAVWVLRTDAAFEESAAEASAVQARKLDALRSRRPGAVAQVAHPARVLPLAPLGPPAVALLWKNAMWLVRTRQLRGLVAPPAIGALLVALVATRSANAAAVIGIVALVVVVAMVMVGPLTTRNDLRTELLHLSVLKTYPLRGRDIVLAEVASGALPVAIMQYLLVLVALAAFSLDPASPVWPGLRWAVVLAAPVPLLGVELSAFMIHNAIALSFPGWTRLGPAAGGGVETLGLGMITLALSAFSLMLLLLVPAMVLAAAVVVLPEHRLAGAMLGSIAAGLVLLGQGVVCAWALGGMLDRIEPMAVEG